MLYGPRPQEETQSYIAKFLQWVKLLSSCRKNTVFGICAQDTFLDFKKIHPFCAVNSYNYDKSSKNTTMYSVILIYIFRPERL